MSENPIKLINENILNFSDIIYVHNEIKNRDEVIKLIKNKNKIPGIVLHSIYDYPDIESCKKRF